VRPRGVHHVAIDVRDLDAAEAFYGGVLGLPLLARHATPDGAPRSVWLDMGDGAILMLERGAGGHGKYVLALRIAREERAAWSAKLAVQASTAYTLYVLDPDGNKVGLSHYPEPAI